MQLTCKELEILAHYYSHGSKAIKCFSCAKLATCLGMEETRGVNCKEYITSFLSEGQVMKLLGYKGNHSYFSYLLQNRKYIKRLAQKLKAKVSPEYRVIVLIMPTNTRFVLKEVTDGDTDPDIIYQKECPNYYKQDNKENEISRHEWEPRKWRGKKTE